MNNSTIAWKTRAQLDDFMVKMFHGFSKPQNKFIRDMVYGIQATGDTILTDIARAVDSEGRHRNVENRLSRNLQAEGLAQGLQDAVMDDAKRFIDKNTLIIVDPTDVCKPHASKMEHLTLVRDASRSTKDNVVRTRGYHGCMAVACRPGSRKTVPLALKLWSSNAAGHKGENEEVLDVLRAIDRATDGKGARVYDRGGDRPAFYDYYLDNGRKFITRMNERDLVSWKRPKPNTWLASQCIMRHKAVVSFDSHGKETRRKIDFGVMPVKLPWRGEELRLVVVRGFGQKPMMLLTNLAVNEKLQAEGKDGTDHSYKALWQVVEIPVALAGRGDDPLRQAVLRLREHPRHVLRKLEEPVRPGIGDCLLHGCLARARRQEGRARRPHRAHAPAVQRRAGVLPVCARRRHKAGVLALRHLEDKGRDKAEKTCRQPARSAWMGRARVPRRGMTRPPLPRQNAHYTC